MKYEFSRDLITDRMNALGLSERAVVQQTQIPYFQFRQARKTGQLDGHVTLSQLHRLAAQLGLGVHELLAPMTTKDDEASSPSPRTEDVEVLIPLLVTAPHLVALPHATRSLGWSRQRMEAALEQIPGALEGTGLRLHRIRDKAKVNPVDLSKPLAQTITRLQTATSGLKATQASTLRRIVNGAKILQRNIGKEEQLVLGSLKNMGCVELDAGAQYRPSEDLRLVLPDIS